MAWRFQELPPRARVYLGLGLAVAIAAAGWQILIDPARREIAHRRDRLARVEEEIRRARQWIVERPAVDEDLRVLERRGREVGLDSAHDKDPQGVLTSLRGLAVDAGLELVSFKPRP